MISFKARLQAALAQTRAHLVGDWKQALKWSSVRLHLAVLALYAVTAAMPSLDPQIAGMFPKALQSPLIGVYATLALVLRITQLKAGG